MSEISMLSSGTPAASAMPSPSQSGTDSGRAMSYEFHSSLSEEERRFYLKAYPTVDVVRERKTHCTVCKIHIGTAPSQEEFIKMHPILRVTHCNKCHDFYNSGEFSKGEDGSELYCRWCGQGGEVYCCSSCPYVFCKSCIVKNLSRGVVSDIEQNENWNCFSCAPKILWPLRAQHWALMNYLDQQKREICAMNLNELELKHNLSKDRSKCCRLAKSKCGNMSDSMESLDSLTSKRSHGSTGSAKKQLKSYSSPSPQPKRQKTNDEVVCTPDLLSMLEPDCQITVTPKPTQQQRPQHSPSASTPKVMCIQPAASIYGGGSPQLVGMQKSSVPPPLVLRNTAVKVRTVAPPPPIVRRTVIGPRTPSPGGAGAPVYHTINGYRIDLNSAAQQETFRLPNGKLIQVKRQGAPPTGNAQQPQTTNWQITTPQQQQQQQQQQRVVPQTIASRPVQITQHTYPTMQQQLQGQNPQVVRYNNVIGSTTITHNGTPMQVINGQVTGPAPPVQAQQQAVAQQSNVPMRPVMIRHVFGDTPIGHARTGLQEQVFNAMEICTHLTNKVQTLTNSNAYKQAKNYLEVKELYIHLSYLLTYAIGRFKGLQDKCLADMRQLGFVNDADSLENGQLAADKQASDDEDNEIQIVEPKTDLINLDSDEEDDQPPSKKPNVEQPKQPSLLKLNSRPQIQIKPVERLINKPPVSVATNTNTVPIKPVESIAEISLETMALDFLSGPGKDREPNADDIDHMDFMATSFLASFLEVDIEEGTSSSSSSAQKKQPRKKLTNKPNPTLIRQKEMMQRERLEEMKRNDLKLKMQCSIALKRVENDVPRAKELLKALLKKREEETKPQNTDKPEDKTEDNISEKDMLEVEIILEENDDEVLNSSGTVVLLDDSDVNETEEDKPKKIEAEKSDNGNSNDKEKLDETKDKDKEKPIASDKTIDKETVKEKAANSEESAAKTTEKETVEEQQQQKEEKSATKSNKEVINLDSTLEDEDDMEEVKQKSPENKTKTSEENSMEIDDEKVKDKSPEKNDEVTDEPMEVDDDTKVEEKKSENTKVKENQKPAIDNDDVEVYKKIDEILQDGANKSTNDEIPKSDDNTEEKIETKELAQSNKQRNVEVMDSSETSTEKKEDELNKEEEVMESSPCSDTEKKLSDDESEEKKKELDSNATIPNTLDSNDASKSIAEQEEKLAEVKDNEDEAEKIKANEDEAEEIKANKDEAEEVKSNEDKVEEDEAEEDKAEDDKAKDDKAKDDKAKEDKAKEDITEKDESEKDKAEQDKAEVDETQEDVTEEDEIKEHSPVTVNGIETNAIENVDKPIETKAIEKTIAEDAPKTPAPQIPTESDNSSTTNISSSSTASEPDKDNSTVATT